MNGILSRIDKLSLFKSGYKRGLFDRKVDQTDFFFLIFWVSSRVAAKIHSILTELFWKMPDKGISFYHFPNW